MEKGAAILTLRLPQEAASVIIFQNDRRRYILAYCENGLLSQNNFVQNLPMRGKRMETLELSSVRNDLAALIARVEKGDEIAIAHDGGNEAVAVIVPFTAWREKPQRQLGSLRNRGPVYFANDFLMSDNELLNS